MISNCGHDENGRYSGGKAGDQTGTEWRVINWYNRPCGCESDDCKHGKGSSKQQPHRI